MRAALYCRVSTEEQAREGYSIDNQLTVCRRVCQDRGWAVAGEYIDAGISGRYEAIGRRPAFKRLLDDAQAGRFQVVVVWQLDRFSRNTVLTLSAFSLFQKHQVDFFSHNERLDYTTPTGRLQLSVLAAFAQYFSDNLGVQVSAGKLGRKRKGLHNGHLPFGTVAGTDGVAVPDPATYPGLVLAYQLAADGASDAEVARALNAAGYRIAKGRSLSLFTANSVCQLLPNRFYLGELPENGGWMPGKHQPLVDASLFERALAHRRQRFNDRGPHSSPKGIFALTGLVRCGYCGCPMWMYRAQGEGRHAAPDRARCSGRIGRGECPQPVVPLWVLEDAVGVWLAGLVVPPEAVEMAIARQAPKQDTNGTNKARIEAALGRLREMYQWGDISRNEYQSQAGALRAQLAAIPAPVVAADLHALAAGLRDAAGVWGAATAQERHQIAVRVIERVVVTGRDVAIVPRPEVAVLLVG